MDKLQPTTDWKAPEMLQCPTATCSRVRSDPEIPAPPPGSPLASHLSHEPPEPWVPLCEAGSQVSARAPWGGGAPAPAQAGLLAGLLGHVSPAVRNREMGGGRAASETEGHPAVTARGSSLAVPGPLWSEYLHPRCPGTPAQRCRNLPAAHKAGETEARTPALGPASEDWGLPIGRGLPGLYFTGHIRVTSSQERGPRKAGSTQGLGSCAWASPQLPAPPPAAVAQQEAVLVLSSHLHAVVPQLPQ